MNAIGTALKEYRIKTGISQEALAGHLGVSQSQLGHYEAGENAPTAASLKRIAKALGWTARRLGELVLGSDYPTRKNRPRRRLLRSLVAA